MSMYDEASSLRIMYRFTTLFPPRMLDPYAEFLGGVERDGMLQIPVFVWAFVFGSCLWRNRTLAGFRRSCYSPVDEMLSPGGFY